MAPSQNLSRHRRGSRWAGALRLAAGLGLVALLVHSGQLDMRSALRTTDSWAIFLACVVLMYITIPILAWRWSIILRTFGLALPFPHAFNITAIGMVGNLVLLGALGGDALRLLYARRALGGGTGRIAVSILADRALGLLALLCIAATVAVLNWDRLQRAPALALLGHAMLLGLGAAVVGVAVLTILPAGAVTSRLRRLPKLALAVDHVHQIVRMIRTNPRRLLAAFALGLPCQACYVAIIALIAHGAGIGILHWTDYGVAGPLSLIANALPLTPNGLGVGEMAFDQICRWLEPQASGAAYSSVFFAFRAVGVLVALPGLLSFTFFKP